MVVYHWVYGLRHLPADCLELRLALEPYASFEDGTKKKKVKEVDLYSAFIEVPYTQGAQVRITQCYLQITSYLPLPRKHSPDGASPD